MVCFYNIFTSTPHARIQRNLNINIRITASIETHAFRIIIVVNNNYTIYLVYAANKSDRYNYGSRI